MADTVPAQGPAATGTSTGATTATAPATTGASGTTTSTQAPSTNNATTGNANTNTSTTTTDPNGGNRGLPYYEKLRRDLRDALQKKRLMDKSMAQLEDQIFRFEQSYLEETTAGNIIKGFDNYIKGSGSSTGLGASGIALAGGMGGAARRKAQVTDADRVFSRSSASFMRDSPAPSSVQTTPSLAPTPTSAYNGSNGKLNGEGTSSAAASVKGSSSSSSSKNKKKSGGANGGNKDKDKDDEGDEGGDKPPAKRLKITYGRD
ncbi:chromatin modification-related protein EAF6 [Aspergillus lentulus]|uniref:Chromatin modification-related protein EAF6 n=1 Tax=Aspergillus lentulus TaxID=293939 RepID=A0AAN5YM80_ASPLE|nr:chromatin modification-related protein EAF6 [Aspergillus lentulus]KAF4158320.1 hypothetical protein CNMCM6069_004253 [Aspergillus lentulus]KAF4164132.1 hypothetical protein CNMCM6936_009495 [Aspergillus lentulus]KAF4175995.1 hypothetical protein CNMCM8060_006699 [Aspergillus lentulus]KAF4186074.1 hypothetical protein CNMCM7927_005986 [Aspergillus lentulus]KAF4196309.1 hypothetical protein CNMCM8694_005221 [Aspergillus lentulus]